MRNFLIIILLSTLFIGCNNYKKNNNPYSKPVRLHRIQDSIGYISLPFIANFDSTIQNTYKLRQDIGLDSLFRADFDGYGDIYLVGFLPDTNNFFSVLFLGVAAATNPGIINFNKNGNKISSVFLTNENCYLLSGETLICKEFTRINTDYSLDYEFTSSIILENQNSQA